MEVVKLAVDLLVREPDIEGFFGGLTKTMVEESGSHTCAVWLLDDDAQRCKLWLAYIGDRLFVPPKSGAPPCGSTDNDRKTFPCDYMSAHLFGYTEGWHQTVEYTRDDGRLPELDAGVCCSNGMGYRPGDSAPFGEPQPGMDDGVEFSHDRAREPLVAHCPDRSHCAAGGAGAAPQPTGRSQSARRAPQGDSGRAKSPRPRHPRQPGAGVCRDSDAAAGCSAGGRQHAAGRRVEYSHCR